MTTYSTVQRYRVGRYAWAWAQRWAAVWRAIGLALEVVTAGDPIRAGIIDDAMHGGGDLAAAAEAVGLTGEEAAALEAEVYGMLGQELPEGINGFTGQTEWPWYDKRDTEATKREQA